MKKLLFAIILLSSPAFAVQPQKVITLENGVTLKRIKTPHGWLVATDGTYGSSITYVPDENHTWQLDKDLKQPKDKKEKKDEKYNRSNPTH